MEFLGERPALLFSHAISAGTNCLVGSTFFRRVLAAAEDDPNYSNLDERERLLTESGRQLALDAHCVSDVLFRWLNAALDAELIVVPPTFGGPMVATNHFNNALRVDLDEYHWPYRKASESRGSESAVRPNTQGELRS